MKKIIKKLLILTNLHKPLLKLDPRRNSLSIVRGKIKQYVVKKYAKKYNCTVLIETGTYKGDMVNATKRLFLKIFSIELSPELYSEAKKRFSKEKHITLHCGDSGMVLKDILKSIDVPAVFWLDAHYSKSITARGDKDTPIVKELETIVHHPIKNHVILIDDARCFNGTSDYPTIAEVENFIKTNAPHYSMKVVNDIIRITHDMNR